jgi:hypothetical protein
MGRNLLRAEVFRRWTVDQWYEPFAAIREFADQDLLGRSDNADEEHRRLGDELPSEAGMTAEEYKNARDQADRASVRVIALRALLQEDLERQLVSGDLIARGFREPLPTVHPISPFPGMNGELSSWSRQATQPEAVLAMLG